MCNANEVDAKHRLKAKCRVRHGIGFDALVLPGTNTFESNEEWAKGGSARRSRERAAGKGDNHRRQCCATHSLPKRITLSKQ